MSETAFIVKVPEAEPVVGELRSRFDPVVKLGVPAHITILVPFMPPEQITAAVMRQVASALRAFPSFSFTLSRVGRFPATAYLAPEPADAFVALTEALVRQFPAYPPFGGEHASIVPHLTVANGHVAEAALAAAELEALMRASGPIHGTCSAVTLLENSSGLWKEIQAFSLPHAVG